MPGTGSGSGRIFIALESGSVGVIPGHAVSILKACAPDTADEEQGLAGGEGRLVFGGGQAAGRQAVLIQIVIEGHRLDPALGVDHAVNGVAVGTDRGLTQALGQRQHLISGGVLLEHDAVDAIGAIGIQLGQRLGGHINHVIPGQTILGIGSGNLNAGFLQQTLVEIQRLSGVVQRSRIEAALPGTGSDRGGHILVDLVIGDVLIQGNDVTVLHITGSHGGIHADHVHRVALGAHDRFQSGEVVGMLIAFKLDLHAGLFIVLVNDGLQLVFPLAGAGEHHVQDNAVGIRILIVRVILLTAASHQGKCHDSSKKQCNNLFHLFFLLNISIESPQLITKALRQTLFQPAVCR